MEILTKLNLKINIIIFNVINYIQKLFQKLIKLRYCINTNVLKLFLLFINSCLSCVLEFSTLFLSNKTLFNETHSFYYMLFQRQNIPHILKYGGRYNVNIIFVTHAEIWPEYNYC